MALMMTDRGSIQMEAKKGFHRGSKAATSQKAERK